MIEELDEKTQHVGHEHKACQIFKCFMNRWSQECGPIPTFFHIT